MNGKRLLVSLLALTLSASPLWADTVKGRIQQISKKAGTIQLDVKGKPPVVVRFGPATQFDGPEGVAALNPPDLVKVEYTPGQPAARVEKIVFGLPPGVEIDIYELLDLMQGLRVTYTLGDARPPKRYREGHVPSAIATPAHDRDALLATLPEDKNQLLVFYCGGPTCPFTGKAVGFAREAGYTNIRGFQEGMPGWKRNNLPVHASRGWVAENLDEHHILIDVRDPAVAASAHIPTAVTLPAAELQAMTEDFIRRQVPAKLQGVSDKYAPIVLYSDTHADPALLLAYKELKSWGYKNVSVVEGGLNAWKADGLPLAANQLAQQIQYTKKLAEGAAPMEEFVRLSSDPKATLFLDVRSLQEVDQKGMLQGALHIPLDGLEERLDELPRDREIITYCENGIRAEMAYRTLKDKGFKVRFLNEVVEFTPDGRVAQ